MFRNICTVIMLAAIYANDVGSPSKPHGLTGFGKVLTNGLSISEFAALINAYVGK